MTTSVIIGFLVIWNLFSGSLSYTEDVVRIRTRDAHPSIHPFTRPTSNPSFPGPIRRWSSSGDEIDEEDSLSHPRARPHLKLVRIKETTVSSRDDLDPFKMFSDSLGALNKMGSYLVNMNRETDSSANDPAKELPSALYAISKQLLGKNVTEQIPPPVQMMQIHTISPPSPSTTTTEPTTTTTTTMSTTTSDEKDSVEGEASGKVEKIAETTDQQIGERDSSSSPSCTTADGGPGKCRDLSNCPQLLLDLTKLRQSICFKSLFVPGVCCPVDKIIESIVDDSAPSDSSVIQSIPRPPRPTTTQAPSRPVQIFPPKTTTTTRRPFLQLIPDLISNATSFFDQVDNNSIQDEDECGVRAVGKYRVVGGEEALPGRWPWMAAIYLHGTKKKPGREYWCGGSLIGSRHILTAAHCAQDRAGRVFSPRQFTVRLGDIDLERDDEPSSPETFGVRRIHIHEKFNRVGLYNDIALMELDRPIRRTPYIIPICLPQSKHKGESFAGTRATVVGWGSTYWGSKESTVQRQAALPVWRNEDCNQAYLQPIVGNFLCAGYTQGDKDACQGDSGGPLMLKSEGKWMQIGIVSFGHKCGEPGYPGVYTRVSEFADWIKKFL